MKFQKFKKSCINFKKCVKPFLKILKFMKSCMEFLDFMKLLYMKALRFHEIILGVPKLQEAMN